MINMDDPAQTMTLEELMHGQNLSVDHQLAMRTALSRLEDEFAGTFNSETIERFLTSSYDQFQRQAALPHYVPLLAERFSKQRLRAFSRVTGATDDGKPVVLFLCVHNAGKSQMALGWFQHFAGDRAVAWSGGSEPATQLNKHSVEAMAEVGIDIGQDFPKPWTEETLRAADVIVTMGCGDACPVYPGKRYLDWDFNAPPADSLEAVRPTRDKIRDAVLGLLAELEVEVTAPVA